MNNASPCCNQERSSELVQCALCSKVTQPVFKLSRRSTLTRWKWETYWRVQGVLLDRRACMHKHTLRGEARQNIYHDAASCAACCALCGAEPNYCDVPKDICVPVCARVLCFFECGAVCAWPCAHVLCAWTYSHVPKVLPRNNKGNIRN
eukprot:4050816-Amphidinium_carterae.1